jgi:uncharacterized protein (DUF2147 family)
MRKVIIGPALAMSLAAAATAVADPARAAESAIAGRWVTEGFGSIVEFRPCAGPSSELCGRIVWLWASAPEGRSRVDRSNPDPALRSRPLVGIEIVRGLRETSPGVWAGGRLYNPDDGRTYTGSARLRGGLLELKGCAFKMACRSQTWRRPQDVLAAAQVR